MCPVRQEAAFGTAASKDASGGPVLLLARPPLKCVQCGRRLSTVCGVGCSAGRCKCVRCDRMPFSAPLKVRRVPQKPVFGTEYLFRTVEACFEHRVPLKTRRVPEEAFLSTARIFGTVGGPLRYRVPSKGQGKGPPEISSALAGRRKWWKGPPQRSLAHRGHLADLFFVELPIDFFAIFA